MLHTLHPLILRWQVWSGAAYSLGIAFLVWDSLHFNHAIWHVFVIGGTLCGYMAIALSALPQHILDREKKGENSFQLIWDFVQDQLNRADKYVYSHDPTQHKVHDQ